MARASKTSPHATLAFVGDVMLGRLVDKHLRQRDPEWAWGDVLDLLRDADAVFANLECAITHFTREWRTTPKTFHFRGDPFMIDVLRAGNIGFVNLANNHALDYQREGLVETIALLDQAGIAHAGAGADAATATAPAFLRAASLMIAAFGVTDNMPEAGATEDESGVAYVAANIEESGPSKGDIDHARAKGADLVVVSAHLGPNMVSAPRDPIRAYKQRLAARGADIVHGHSAHVVQGLERAARALIMHDAGDFIDDYAVEPQLRNDLSFLFLIEAGKEGLRRARLIPVRLYMAQVRLAAEAEAEWICTRMQALSRTFGVELERTSKGLELDLAQNGAEAGSSTKTLPEPVE